jgi:hypothetical protein
MHSARRQKSTLQRNADFLKIRPMADIAPDTIIARFDPLCGYWIAHFPATPQVAFGGNLPMLAVRRLLEGTEALPDTYLVHYDRSETDTGHVQSIVWEPPEILFDCTECNGTGQYVGLIETGPCKVCGGRKVQTA